MFVLFVGGYAHGQVAHVQDGLTAVEVAGLNKVDMYGRHQWLNELPAQGFDAVFVSKDVETADLDQLLNDAVRQAQKQLE